MNIKNIFRIAFCCLVVMTTASCKKWLDLKPVDGIVRQEFWQTKEQIESAVVGCYSSLLGDPTGRDRPLPEYFFLWGELRADMVAPGFGIATEEQDIINVNTLPSNSIVRWSAVYRTINSCNTVIDFAPDVLNRDKTLTEAKLNSYLAEARGLRALMYFYLVRTFRDVPLKLKSTSSDADLQQLPKTSGDSVLQQIVADLAFSDNHIAFSYGNNAIDKGRLTKYAIKAIQSDVYLWMDKYKECEDACNFIIDSRRFGLVAGNSGWFNTLYVQENSNESIFEIQFDNQKLNSFYPLFATARARFLASPLVMEEFYTIDFNDENNKDIRGEGASVRTSDNAIWKYYGMDVNTARTQDAFYANWKVFRYAQTLLDKAEAINQMGRGPEALQLVKTVRARANALQATYPSGLDSTDKRAMTDFILEERAREFAFEGKRWYDLLRNAKRNNYERQDLLTSMIVKAVPPIRQQSALGKYSDKDSHYFPIYLSEIENAPSLIQNPFYK